MNQEDLIALKIRSYLEDFSPQAVESLVRSLEKVNDSNAADPHAELISSVCLDILRHSAPVQDKEKEGLLRCNQIQRQFFRPLDEFLINEFLPHKQKGRIHRPMLNRVWTWVGRDLMPGEVGNALKLAKATQVSDDRVDQAVTQLRSLAIEAVAEVLEKIEGSEKERRRLSIEVGGERGIADLHDINMIFQGEKWLAPFLQAMPDSLSEKRFTTDKDVLLAVQKCFSRYPEYLPIVAVAILERADSPSALCSFAGRLAGKNDVRTISKSPFSTFVDVVLSEAERLNILAQRHLEFNPDPVAFSQALSDYDRLVSGVEKELDLAVAVAWRDRLSETKKELSAVVARELEGTLAAVRRALRVPPVDENGAVHVDNGAVDAAVRSLRSLVIVRNSPETFAMNDLGARTHNVVEQTLEIVTRGLIADLGKTREGKRIAHLAAVDTAIMLSEIYFGGEYANQLRRSRQSALDKEAGSHQDNKARSA